MFTAEETKGRAIFQGPRGALVNLTAREPPLIYMFHNRVHNLKIPACFAIDANGKIFHGVGT